MKFSLVLLLVLVIGRVMWDRAGGVGAGDTDDVNEAMAIAVVEGDADGVLRRLAAGAPLVDDAGTPVVVWAAWQGQTGVLEALIEHGVDVNVRTPAGWSALMMAVMAERADAVEALLNAGADLDVRTDVGATALSMAIDRGNEGIVEMLLRAGAGRGEVVAAGR